MNSVLLYRIKPIDAMTFLLQELHWRCHTMCLCRSGLATLPLKKNKAVRNLLLPILEMWPKDALNYEMVSLKLINRSIMEIANYFVVSGGFWCGRLILVKISYGSDMNIHKQIVGIDKCNLFIKHTSWQRNVVNNENVIFRNF